MLRRAVPLLQKYGQPLEEGIRGRVSAQNRLPSRFAFVATAPRLRRITPTSSAACIIFVVASVAIAWNGHGQRSAWIVTSFPGDSLNAHNPLLGYNCLHGPDPIMLENVAGSISQVAFFSGIRQSEAGLDCYIFRAYYGLFVTLLTPLFGVLRAAFLVNWLAWALCAWVAWRLSKRLFDDDLAAFLAVILVIGGMGMIIHIRDYSAHLLSFASYYLGFYLLYVSGIASERRPLRTHLLLGAFLAVACLVYQNGFVLIAVYVLLALRHNALWHVGEATFLAVTSRPLWQITLPWLLGVRVADIETGHLGDSLQGWRDLLQEPWMAIVQKIADYLSEFALFDSPLVVALGFFSCVYAAAKPGLRWFGAVVLAVPMLSVLFWLPTLQSRGYPVYGATVWIYCCLGGLLARGLRRIRVMMYTQLWVSPHRCLLSRLTRCGLLFIAWLGLCVTIASHFVWSTAHLWHEFGPAKAYIAGWRNAWPYFVYPRPHVVSMTGFEDTPVICGGEFSLAEAGAVIGQRDYQLDRGALSLGKAFMRRLLPFAYLGLLGAVCMRTWRRGLLVAGLMLIMALLTGSLSWATMRVMPLVFDFHSSIAVRSGGRLIFRATLSPSFLHDLQSKIAPEDSLDFFIPLSAYNLPGLNPDVTIQAGSTPLSVEADEWNLTHFRLWRVQDRALAVQALAEVGQIAIEVVNPSDQPLRLAGWQRDGLPGREHEGGVRGDGNVGHLQVVPAIEIRLIRPCGSLKVLGF